MKRLLFGIALLFGGAVHAAAPVPANLTEVQVTSENGQNYLSMVLDRDLFGSTCPKYVADQRVYIPLEEDSIASDVLVSQALNALDTESPIAVSAGTACNDNFGLEVKDFTVLRNVSYEYNEKRMTYDHSGDKFIGGQYRYLNSSPKPIRVTVYDGRRNTYNCDLRGYTGSSQDTMLMVAASTVGDGKGKDQLCHISFNVAPNSWYRVESSVVSDVFPKECDRANFDRWRSAYEEYRYRAWHGKKKYHQNLRWKGQMIFGSCGSCTLPWRSGAYVYKDPVYVRKDNHTHVYSLCRQRDTRNPSGSVSYKYFITESK